MSKVIGISVVCLLLVGSATLAQPIIGGAVQDQSFTTIMINTIGLNHGTQSANSDNWATLNNVQNAIGQCGLFVNETQMGFISQVGQANGCCALIGLDQAVEAMGIQGQMIGDGVAPKTETQTLFLDGHQLLTKADGAGNVTGNQMMSLHQDQLGQNGIGSMDQSSTVFGSQVANISGAPGATGIAGSSLNVLTAQTQIVQ